MADIQRAGAASSVAATPIATGSFTETVRSNVASAPSNNCKVLVIGMFQVTLGGAETSVNTGVNNVDGGGSSAVVSYVQEQISGTAGQTESHVVMGVHSRRDTDAAVYALGGQTGPVGSSVNAYSCIAAIFIA